MSVAIQAHPARGTMAAELAACVGGADVVYDPAPDDGLVSPWRTYRDALERTPAGATYRLVVQEDVLACGYFREGVQAAVEASPDRVICFFVAGNPRIHRDAVVGAADRGRSWVELALTTWIPVVATLWPVRLIDPLLAWYDAQRAAKVFPLAFTADDEIAGRFLRHIGEPPLASVPSLVEHPDDIVSVANGNRRGGDGLDPGRRAAVWVGDVPALECDARRIDWTLR